MFSLQPNRHYIPLGAGTLIWVDPTGSSTTLPLVYRHLLRFGAHECHTYLRRHFFFLLRELIHRLQTAITTGTDIIIIIITTNYCL